MYAKVMVKPFKYELPDVVVIGERSALYQKIVLYYKSDFYMVFVRGYEFEHLM
jgi:hypothetical protein